MASKMVRRATWGWPSPLTLDLPTSVCERISAYVAGFHASRVGVVASSRRSALSARMIPVTAIARPRTDFRCRERTRRQLDGLLQFVCRQVQGRPGVCATTCKTGYVGCGTGVRMAKQGSLPCPTGCGRLYCSRSVTRLSWYRHALKHGYKMRNQASWFAKCLVRSDCSARASSVAIADTSRSVFGAFRVHMFLMSYGTAHDQGSCR